VISIGIIGGSGYTGKHLIQICEVHPFIASIEIYGQSTVGKTISSIFPELSGRFSSLIVQSTESISYEHDAYFIALPHGEALKYVPALIEKNKLVIDLGGDYRLDSAELYQQWYKIQHTSPELLQNKVYGLADFIEQVQYKDYLIANPGCYPTATLLGILPFIEKFGDEILTASTVAYSGTSGAGKSANVDMIMSEMFGNARAYNVNAHRHQPEIEQMMHSVGFNAPYAFTVHLLPVAVGIYATTTIHMKSEIEQSLIEDVYKEKYDSSLFVRMRNVPPHLRWVINSNYCDINVAANGKTLIITSAIDNLIKGASGQAVQNLNKFYAWDETMGILNNGGEHASVSL